MREVLKRKDVMKTGLRGIKEYTDYNWHGKVISIKYMLPRNEVYELIQNVYQMCLSSSGDFTPEFVGFALRANIVSAYALVELPEDIEELYTLLYYSDLFNVVLNNACKSQLDDIVGYFDAWKVVGRVE